MDFARYISKSEPGRCPRKTKNGSHRGRVTLWKFIISILGRFSSVVSDTNGLDISNTAFNIWCIAKLPVLHRGESSMFTASELPTHVSEQSLAMSILFSFLYTSSTILHCDKNQEIFYQLDSTPLSEGLFVFSKPLWLLDCGSWLFCILLYRFICIFGLTLFFCACDLADISCLFINCFTIWHYAGPHKRGNLKFCSWEKGGVVDEAQETFEGKVEGESFKISKKEMRNRVQFTCSMRYL